MFWDQRQAKPKEERKRKREEKRRLEGEEKEWGQSVRNSECGEERKRIRCVQSEERGEMNGVSGAPRMGGEERRPRRRAERGELRTGEGEGGKEECSPRSAERGRGVTSEEK
eukprot:1274202-Rhodomonas_salina.1